jgi:hypothetical protein
LKPFIAEQRSTIVRNIPVGLWRNNPEQREQIVRLYLSLDRPHVIQDDYITVSHSRKVSVELRLRDAGRVAVIAPNPRNRQLKNMPDPREPHDSLYGAGGIDHHQSATRTGFRKPPTQLDCLLTIQYFGRMPRADAHENVTRKFRYSVHRLSLRRINAIESANLDRSKPVLSAAKGSPIAKKFKRIVSASSGTITSFLLMLAYPRGTGSPTPPLYPGSS